jgi:hypothetical protein
VQNASEGVMTVTMDRPAIRRPDPVHWLWYAYGGRLPSRYRGWVCHDLTTRTWPLRHVVRALLQVAPVIALILLFAPGDVAVRAGAVTAGLLLGLLYSCAYMYEIAEHRMAKAGYPVGTAARVREEADHERRAAQAERYARTWRAPDAGPDEHAP